MKIKFFLNAIILALVINLLANMIWKYIPETNVKIDKIITAVLIITCIMILRFQKNKSNLSKLHDSFVFGWTYASIAVGALQKIPAEIKNTEYKLISQLIQKLKLSRKTIKIIDAVQKHDLRYQGIVFSSMQKIFNKELGKIECISFEAGFWLAMLPLIENDNSSLKEAFHTLNKFSLELNITSPLSYKIYNLKDMNHIYLKKNVIECFNEIGEFLSIKSKSI